MSRLGRVLVVDDDPALCELLGAYLSDSGYEVECATSGTGMRLALERTPPDALVLDLMMPGEDGLALTRELRAPGSRFAQMPILMLSARGEEIDRVVGLELGADDYLAKPFSPRELLARLRALMRRAQSSAHHESNSDRAQFGPFSLDVEALRLLRDGVDVGLSGAEFALLKVFVERPNRVLSRDLLMDLLKGYDWDPNDRTIDIRVGRLRRKIERDAAHPAYVRTVRGEGYLFNPRGESA